MGLALGTNLKFYTSVAKGLKLKVRKRLGLIPTFVEVTEKKLVGGGGGEGGGKKTWIGLKHNLPKHFLYFSSTQKSLSNCCWKVSDIKFWLDPDKQWKSENVKFETFLANFFAHNSFKLFNKLWKSLKIWRCLKKTRTGYEQNLLIQTVWKSFINSLVFY